MIRTDGATLYDERRGSGPALLMIPGGGGDAGFYRKIAELLADSYTVLTYDRRGNSRSTVDDPAAPLRMAEQSADALAVLAHHGFPSAVVFGGSGGALIGLDLTARAPRSVDALIAHEPPVRSLLTPADDELFNEIKAIRRSEGPLPAWLRFTTSIDRPESPALVRHRLGRRVLATLARAGRVAFRIGPQELRTMSRLVGNAEYLMVNEFDSFLSVEPDFAALAGVPIVVGVGATSRQGYPGRAGEAVAARLGVPVVEFPGDHAGYLEEPEPFAARLRTVITGLSAALPDR